MYSVCCLGGDNIWICGMDNTMRLFKIDGILVKSIETKSGNRSQNIVVVMETQVDEITRLNKWMPLDVCSTFSYDLLVIMVSGNE